MPAWSLFPNRNPHRETATDLYGRLVACSRTPWFYSHAGVADTPEGRFELLLLHVVLALRRLTADGAAAGGLARALTETFVTDMDDCLREMGVGDQTVAKKVKRAAAALYDRNRDYGAALDRTGQGDGEADDLAVLLARHVLGQDEPAATPTAAAAALANHVRAADAMIRATPAAAVATGDLHLLTPAGNLPDPRPG